jgi:hypothetical protein
MKPSLCIALLVGLACAASDKQVRPQREVHFPENFPLSQEIQGAEVQALMAVAKDLDLERGDSSEDDLTRCMSGIRARGFTVVREGDVFYILVMLKPQFCGSSAVYVDTSIFYAVDADGRILRKHQGPVPPK